MAHGLPTFPGTNPAATHRRHCTWLSVCPMDHHEQTLTAVAAQQVVTRFAPSPTGHLHLGHVRSAWEGWHAARKAGGRFLLRIEDIDRTRCRAEFDAAIRNDLAWLGLDWGGGVRRQSEHFADYCAALARLDGAGMLYPCFCTRKEIQAEIARAGGAPQGEDGPIYPGTCRLLSAGEGPNNSAVGCAHARRGGRGAAPPAPGGALVGGAGGRRPAADPAALGDV